MARHGKSIAKQSEGRAGKKYLPVGGRVKKWRAIETTLAPWPVRPLSRRLEDKKEEKGSGRGGWDDFLGAVEVTLTTMVLFWASIESRERGCVLGD